MLWEVSVVNRIVSNVQRTHFIHIVVSITVMPQISENCEYDAFISSTPFNGKVFLHPWKKTERTADWFETRGYCAKHCAELVTIRSAEENVHFLSFMRSISLTDAVWLGAEVENRTEFASWSNGENVTYSNKAPGEYNEDGRTCLNAAYVTSQNLWYNYYCYHPNYLIACQRPANWTICTRPCYNRYT